MFKKHEGTRPRLFAKGRGTEVLVALVVVVRHRTNDCSNNNNSSNNNTRLEMAVDCSTTRDLRHGRALDR